MNPMNEGSRTPCHVCLGHGFVGHGAFVSGGEIEDASQTCHACGGSGVEPPFDPSRFTVRVNLRGHDEVVAIMEEAKVELERLRARVAELEKEAGESDAEWCCRVHKTDLARRVAELEKENARLTIEAARIPELEGWLQTRIADVRELRARVAELEKENQHLRDCFAVRENPVSPLLARCRALAERVAELEKGAGPGGLAKLEATIPPPPWFCDVDGWPVYSSERGGGTLPIWAKDVPPNRSDDNPYTPYTIDFEGMGALCELRNALPEALARVEIAKGLMKDGFRAPTSYEAELGKRVAELELRCRSWDELSVVLEARTADLESALRQTAIQLDAWFLVDRIDCGNRVDDSDRAALARVDELMPGWRERT